MNTQKHPFFHSFSSIAMVSLVLSLPGCAVPEDSDSPASNLKPWVTVNGFAQSVQLADLLARDQIAKGIPDNALLRENIRELLINQALRVEQAMKNGLDQQPLIQAQIEWARQSILAQAWQQKQFNEIVPSETELKAEYDHQLATLGDKDYQLRHLLVKEEATAKLLLEKIKAGASIEALAHEFSIDPVGRQNGGLTDWANVTSLLPPIAEVVTRLQKGQYSSKPIHTALGWHIIQMEDVRPFKTFTFDQFKPQLQATIAQQMLEQQFKILREKAKVE